MSDNKLDLFKPTNAQLHLRVPVEVKVGLEQLAKRTGKSITKHVCNALLIYLSRSNSR